MIRLERSRLLSDSDDGPPPCRDLGMTNGADLAPIECLAPYTFILERDAAGPPIYGHSGSAIQAVIGSNPHGKGFFDYWDSDARRDLKLCFDVSAESHLAFRLFSIRPRSKNAALRVETT